MRRLAISILAILLAAPPVLAVHRIVPVAGHAPGANGTLWITDLMLFNTLPKQEAVALVFRPGDGAEVSRVLQLAAGESLFVPDAVNPALFPGEHPPAWIGQLEVVADGGVYVHARIFTQAPGEGQGTFGNCSPVLGPEEMLERGILTGIANTAQFRTNLAFVNPSAMTLAFQLVVRNGDGVTVAQPRIAVDPYRSIQVPFAALHAAAGDGYSIEWTSPEWNAYVMASVVDNVSGDPTTIPSAAAGAASLFFPVIGRTEGAFDTHWATSLTLTADSGAPGTVVLELHDNELGTRTASFDVPAHGTIVFHDLYAARGLSQGIGFLRVTSTVPVAGSVRLFNTVEGQTYGSPIASQEPAAVNGFLHIRGVRLSSDHRFNVAIANSDASSAGGFIRVYDGRREVVHSQPFDVPAQTTMQFALPAGLELSAGEVVIQPNQNHALTAIGSEIDNRTGDTVVIEARQ